VRSAFGDVADNSRSKWDAFAVDTQSAAAFDDLADHVLVGVIDLFRIAGFRRTEGDQAAGELVGFKTFSVADFVV